MPKNTTVENEEILDFNSDTEARKKLHFKLFNWQRDAKAMRIFTMVIIFVAALIIIKDEVVWRLDFGSGDFDGDYAVDSNADTKNGLAPDCNVMGINLHDALVTYIPSSARAIATSENEDGELIEDLTSSEAITYYLKKMEQEKQIKAVVLEIDSYGGSPVAGEEIVEAVQKMQKPVIAFIRGGAVSAAYLAASAADIIFASKYSDIGGIGVTMSYVDNVQQNKNEGLFFNELSSGKFKDMPNTNKPLTAEEKALLMRDINIMHNNFVKAVAENRKLAIAKVTALADGSTMMGEAALQNGLIDKIGGLPEVKKYLQEQLNEPVEICW